MDTPQEQLSQGLRRVNPEATSPHHLTSTAAHRRATANYGSGHQVTVTLATGSTLRGTHYRKALGLAGKSPLVWVCFLMGDRIRKRLNTFHLSSTWPV